MNFRTVQLFYRFMLLAAVALHTAVTLQAQSSPDDQEMDGSPPPKADLSRSRYADRQRATLEMWRGRDHSRQAVQDAARDSDPEVAERAEWILKQWRRGLLPGVTPGPNRMSRSKNGLDTLGHVLEQGAFDAVRVAVEESAGTIEYEQTKQRVAKYLTERFPIYADLALAAGSEHALLELVESVAVNRDLATTARDLRRSLEIESKDPDELPALAESWEAFERSVAQAQFAMLRGETDKAIRFAGQSGDPELLRVARMISGRWNEVYSQAIADGEQRNGWEKTEAYIWAFAAATRLGDQERIDDVRSYFLDVTGDEFEMDWRLRWQALATHDEIDGAIDILQNFDRALACKIATVTSRYRRAIELCGFEFDRLELDLDKWIDEAYLEQTQLQRWELADSIERLYGLARLLLSIGDTEHARHIYRRLTPREIIVSQNRESLRERTLSELDLVNRADWIAEMAVADGETGTTPYVRNITAHALGVDSVVFYRVLEAMQEVMPRSSTFAEQFFATCQLFLGETVDAFDQQNDFQRLFKKLAYPEFSSNDRLKSFRVERVIMNAEMVQLFLLHGQTDLAMKGRELLSRSGNVDATIALAETAMEKGDRDQADQLWSRAADQASRIASVGPIVTVDHGLAYAKAVVGRWRLARRSGHLELSKQLEQRVRLMLASPSLTFRKDLADHLRVVGDSGLAGSVLKDLSVLASFGSDEAPDFFQVAIGFASTLENATNADKSLFETLDIQRAEAVRWSDLAILGIVKLDLYDKTQIVSVPLSIRKARLQHAIESGSPAEIERAIARIENYDPLNIDVAESMLPEVSKLGFKSIADAAMDRLLDRGLEHCEQFGMDATMLNNLAWSAAMNEHRLDDAIILSERAVMLEPDSVVFRDTLAEVLHLLGRTREALDVETACLHDQPDQWHLYEQIDKYKEVLGLPVR